ncbi:MAG: purine-nucleoside phosphorylase [candidate division Zixibacteria bacterium]
MDLRSEIKDAVDFIRTKTRATPAIGIILGTGLGALADEIEKDLSISYDEIPHFPVSTVESHAGRFLFGKLGGKDVIAMQGRFHFYEGYDLRQVTFPVRVMKEIGVKILIVSNAAGGLNPQFEIGDLVMITDHINFQTANPLTGPNDETLGPRFPDMYNCYDRELQDLAERTAIDEKVPLKKGVYVGVTGPNLETGAEYRFLRTIGGDLVGMSTVPEVIVARHQGTRVLGFSLATDMGLPDAMEPCSHEKIIAAAAKAEPKLTKLVKKTVERISIDQS